MMSRALNGLIRILEFLTGLLMGLLVLDVLWQVTTRYVLRDPSSWTSELATLLLIWLALLGASLAFVRRSHLGVDFLVSRLPGALRTASEILVFLLVGLFASVVLIYGGLKLVHLTWLTNQVSPTLQVKMGHVYLALPVSGFFIAMFALEGVVRRFAALAKRPVRSHGAAKETG